MRSKILLLPCLFFIFACDPYHKNKCEWYLVPEPDHIKYVEKGWVSICARNFVINRQKCGLKMKLNFAEKVYGKKFKLKDLVLNSRVFPREVLEVALCQ